MARRKRFCDGAGYTQHCWECIHARDWHVGYGYTHAATCEVYDITVEKTDCPNNGSSYIGKICGSYER